MLTRLKVVDAVERWCLKASELYGGVFLPDDVKFDIKRTAMIAGQYRYEFDRHTLRFNPHYLETEIVGMFERTVPHEVAHMVNMVLALRIESHVEDKHGPNWRAIMRDFGVEMSTHHSYDTSHAKPHVYTCGCGDRGVRHFTRQRHARVERGRSIYRCRTCGQRLKYLGEQMKESRYAI